MKYIQKIFSLSCIFWLPTTIMQGAHEGQENIPILLEVSFENPPPGTSTTYFSAQGVEVEPHASSVTSLLILYPDYDARIIKKWANRCPTLGGIPTNYQGWFGKNGRISDADLPSAARNAAQTNKPLSLVDLRHCQHLPDINN